MAKSAPFAVKLKSFSVGRQRGELARLRVIKGPDRGSAFILVNTRASIGRGEENDVVIGDLKASRVHAEFTASPNGWMVRDLGSANGILHNGVQKRETALRTSDLVTIGETVVEFIGAEADERRLLGGPLDEAEAEQLMSSRFQSRERPRTLGDPFGLASQPATPVSGSAGGAKALRLTIAGVLAVVAVVGWDFFSGAPSTNSKTARKVAGTEGEPTDLQSLMPKFEKPSTSRNAEMFFRQGFREYRERNYIRALTQFELVLQLAPDHEMARRYRDNARMAIDDEVRTHLEFGKKTFNAGKLREARGHYEAILRLLHADQSNPAYSEAKEQLDRVRAELGGG